VDIRKLWEKLIVYTKDSMGLERDTIGIGEI